MRAARTIARESLSFEQIPTPTRGPGECLVRVTAVSLCGTDLHIFEDDYPTDLPLVQGHEIAGVVICADPDSPAAEGDPVVVDPLVACGDCPTCRAGHRHVCPRLSILGCYQDGGLTEALAVPADRLHPVPPELPVELAALAEPTSIALEAVSRAEPRAGDVALVLGCGPIGLLATLALSEAGATVVAADVDVTRAALASRFGAAHAWAVGAAFPDPAQQRTLDAATEGTGPRLVLEATGVPASLETAIGLVAPAGRIVQVGISSRPAAVTIKDLTDKEIELFGSRNSRGLIPDALALLRRHRDVVSSLVTHRFGFSDLAAAFRTMADPSVPTGKIVILLDDGAEDGS